MRNKGLLAIMMSVSMIIQPLSGVCYAEEDMIVDENVRVMTTESDVLAGTDVNTTADDWEYTLDETNDRIYLSKYKGSKTEVTVPGEFELEGNTYSAFVEGKVVNDDGWINYINVFTNSSVENVVFEDGVVINDARRMFYNSRIRKVEFKDVDTSNLTDVSYMFDYCEQLEDVDMSGMDLSKVTDAECMFRRCFSLRRIVTPKDVSNETAISLDETGVFCKYDGDEIESMFSDLTEMPAGTELFRAGVKEGEWYGDYAFSLDVDEEDKDIIILKSYRGKDEVVHVPSTTVINEKSYITCLAEYVYTGLGNTLKSVDFESGVRLIPFYNDRDAVFLFGNVDSISMSGVDGTRIKCFQFNGNYGKHKYIDLGNLDLSNTTSLSNLFEFGDELESVKIDKVKLGEITDVSFMFYGCSSLREIDLSSLDMSKVIDCEQMFGSSGIKMIRTPAKIGPDVDADLPCTMYEYKDGAYGSVGYTKLQDAPVGSVIAELGYYSTGDGLSSSSSVRETGSSGSSSVRETGSSGSSSVREAGSSGSSSVRETGSSGSSSVRETGSSTSSSVREADFAGSSSSRERSSSDSSSSTRSYSDSSSTSSSSDKKVDPDSSSSAKEKKYWAEFIPEDLFEDYTENTYLDGDLYYSEDGKIRFYNATATKNDSVIRSRVDVDKSTWAFSDDNTDEVNYRVNVNPQIDLYYKNGNGGYFEFDADREGLIVKVFWRTGGSKENDRTLAIRSVDADGNMSEVSGAEDVPEQISTDGDGVAYAVPMISYFTLPKTGTYRIGAGRGTVKIYRIVIADKFNINEKKTDPEDAALRDFWTYDETEALFGDGYILRDREEFGVVANVEGNITKGMIEDVGILDGDGIRIGSEECEVTGATYSEIDERYYTGIDDGFEKEYSRTVDRQNTNVYVTVRPSIPLDAGDYSFSMTIGGRKYLYENVLHVLNKGEGTIISQAKDVNWGKYEMTVGDTDSYTEDIGLMDQTGDSVFVKIWADEDIIPEKVWPVLVKDGVRYTEKNEKAPMLVSYVPYDYNAAFYESKYHPGESCYIYELPKKKDLWKNFEHGVFPGLESDETVEELYDEAESAGGRFIVELESDEDYKVIDHCYSKYARRFCYGTINYVPVFNLRILNQKKVVVADVGSFIPVGTQISSFISGNISDVVLKYSATAKVDNDHKVRFTYSDSTGQMNTEDILANINSSDLITFDLPDTIRDSLYTVMCDSVIYNDGEYYFSDTDIDLRGFNNKAAVGSSVYDPGVIRILNKKGVFEEGIAAETSIGGIKAEAPELKLEADGHIAVLTFKKTDVSSLEKGQYDLDLKVGEVYDNSIYNGVTITEVDGTGTGPDWTDLVIGYDQAKGYNRIIGCGFCDISGPAAVRIIDLITGSLIKEIKVSDVSTGYYLFTADDVKDLEDDCPYMLGLFDANNERVSDYTEYYVGLSTDLEKQFYINTTEGGDIKQDDSSSSDREKYDSSSEKGSSDSSSGSEKKTDSSSSGKVSEDGSSSSKNEDSSSKGGKTGDSSSAKSTESSSSIASVSADKAKKKAESAISEHKGDVNDTVAVTQMGKKLYLEAKDIGDNTYRVTVVKGCKFIIPDMVKKSAVVSSAAVKVNAKGQVTAKGDTGDAGAIITYRINGSDREQKLIVVVRNPSLTSNSSGVKCVNMGISATTGTKLDVTVNVPLGLSVLNTKNKKNAVADMKLELGEDGRYHLTGTAASKGNASIVLTVNGKKFTIKVKVK